MEPQTASEAAEAAAARLSARTDELGRRVWDKDFFARKAQLRQYENGQDPGMDFLAGEGAPKSKKKSVLPPVERRLLQQRTEAVRLDADLGKMKVITPATPKHQQGGYWCDVCECLVKDSQAYLDHINGKKHNRLLGMNMTVERVSVDSVVQRLQQAKMLKQKQKEAAENGGSDDIYGNIAVRLESEEKKKKKKKKRHKQDEQTENQGLSDHLSQLFPGCNLTHEVLFDTAVSEADSQLPVLLHPRDSRFDIPPALESPTSSTAAQDAPTKRAKVD